MAGAGATTNETIQHHLAQIDRIRRELRLLSEQISRDKRIARAQVSDQFTIADSTRRAATQVDILPRGWGKIADNIVQLGRRRIEDALAQYANAEELLGTVKGRLADLAAALRQRRDSLPKARRQPRFLVPGDKRSRSRKGTTRPMDRTPDLIREEIMRLIFQQEQANPSQYVADSVIASNSGLTMRETNFHFRVLRDDGLLDLSERMTGSSAVLTTRGEQHVRERTTAPANARSVGPVSGPVIHAPYATFQNVATNITGNSIMNVGDGSGSTADVARLIEQLRSALAASGVDGDILVDAQADVQGLESEVRRSHPRLARVKEYVDSLVGIVGPVAATALQVWEVVRTVQGQ